MYHSKQHVETNGKSSLLLALIMLFGALSAGIPNASALTGNETFEVINLTNNSANLSMSNLDSSDTYYWGAYIYHSNGTLFDSDTGSTSGIGGPGTINFGVSWPTPTIPDNYTVYGEVNDGSISIGNDTHYFLIGNKVVRRHLKSGQNIGVGYPRSKNSLFRELNRSVEWIFSNDAVSLNSIFQTELKKLQ